MKKLENKLMDVIAESISMSEFEQWLNSDVDVLISLRDDEFVLEVCTVNLKDRHSSHNLQRIVQNRIGRKLFLAEFILRICQNIVASENKDFIYRMVSLVQGCFSWDEDFGLMNDFYNVYYDIDLAMDGYYTHKEVLHSIFVLAEKVIEKTEGKGKGDKIALLQKGIEVKIWNYVQPEKIHKEIETPQEKKWYQFWKK